MTQGGRATAALLVLLASWAHAATPTQTLVVPGLHSPAEIRIDHWGVPHLYAHSESDLYFTQGFNAARDRLFQMDLWRRRGLGQLSEVFGKDYVEDDRAARLLLYRGDQAKEWKSYGPTAAATARQFVAGINAYVTYVQAHPDQLPVEFRIGRYRPARWQPEDLVRIRIHGLSRNVESEVARAIGACHGSLAADLVRAPLSPSWDAILPTGLDPCLPTDVLHLYTLATREFRLTPPGFPQAMLRQDAEQADGSNNWVISPSKTTTGRPILANDPHRAFTQPSIRYLVGLNAPGLHLVGANEPQMPGISLGHNASIAFGYTIYPADQEDLYVYELDDSLTRYRFGSGWEPLRQIEEPLLIRDAPSRTLQMQFTRHGPVIYVDASKKRAYALRSAWFEPGTSVYWGALRYQKARTLRDFEQALGHWRAPTLNHVYADTKGNIAWLPAGYIPGRAHHDGLMPVPGDGRYEWGPPLRPEQMPRRVNPAEGFLTTSNELNLPTDYPYAELKPGFEWTPGWRHERISSVLGQPRPLSMEDSKRLQTDTVSLPARRLVLAIQDLKTDDGDTRAALALLHGWDGNVTGDSAAAALYETWYTHHLRTAVRSLLMPAAQAATVDGAHVDVIISFAEHPSRWLKDRPTERRDDLLGTTLGAAFRELRTRLGNETARWRWDSLHFNLSEHPFAAIVDDVRRAQLNVGPLPKDGDAFVPSQSSYRAADFRDTGGPSVRLIMDVGDWDKSVAVNHPGQSGDPDSPHYRDLADLWRRGEYFPLLFSRQAVEHATERVIYLNPPGAVQLKR